MSAPDGSGWLDPEDVADVLGDPTMATTPRLLQAVAGAESLVERWRGDLFDASTPPVYVVTADVYQGSKLLAADVYRRSDTYGGNNANAWGDELGGLGVPEVDPLVARLLGIGRWRPGVNVG